jgi:hypothetical protein
MTVHLIKLGVGVHDLHHFAERQKQSYVPYNETLAFPVWTRRAPTRAEELIKGGSLYWVIKNKILARQTILGVEKIVDEENGSHCLIMLDIEIMRVRPFARKPFQGWRYLKGSDVPVDFGVYMLESDEQEDVDPEMEKELFDLGLI